MKWAFLHKNLCKTNVYSRKAEEGELFQTLLHWYGLFIRLQTMPQRTGFSGNLALEDGGLALFHSLVGERLYDSGGLVGWGLRRDLGGALAAGSGDDALRLAARLSRRVDSDALVLPAVLWARLYDQQCVRAVLFEHLVSDVRHYLLTVLLKMT